MAYLYGTSLRMTVILSQYTVPSAHTASESALSQTGAQSLRMSI